MKNTLNIGGKILSLNQPLIMGILNVTPDSFYKDSRFNPNQETFLKKAEAMIREGAHLLDVGGYSTRPNSGEVSENEELDRVIPAVEKLRARFPGTPVSVDTFRAPVARQALDAGAAVINDISGGDFDAGMFPLIIERKPVYLLMHQAGRSVTDMHTPGNYENLLPEVMDKLFRKAAYLRSQGVADILLDPGFGFSKTVEENYRLLQHLDLLQNDHYPLLAGMSRKSMLWKLLQITPEESLPYSLYVHGLALTKGARLVRVHDVLPHARIIRMNAQLK
ncbi:dihydropteroate synthase [Leadbetterella sp. DM7]|uniref:dihydropteroate synthase n=1 Tax=Leadbetterella sp. DM7 TaxID=3235085 RepID=UPI00349EF577